MFNENIFQNLDDLRIFAQVVDSGSLTAAGSVLGVSPAFVSRRLQNLEDRVGRALVHRTTRRLSVSDDGRRLYPHVLRILAAAEGAEDALLGDEGELSGQLRVAVPSLAVRAGLLPGIQAWLAAHPRLSLQLMVVDTEVDVVGGGYDVAIRGGEPRDSGLIAAHVVTVRPVLGACPSYLDAHGRPERPEDLGEHECLRFLSDRPQETWTLIGPDGDAHVVEVSGRFQCNDSEALLAALVAGMGIGLQSVGVPDPRVERVLPAYRFSPIPIYATYPRGLRGSRRLRGFLDVVRAGLSPYAGPSASVSQDALEQRWRASGIVGTKRPGQPG